MSAPVSPTSLNSWIDGAFNCIMEKNMDRSSQASCKKQTVTERKRGKKEKREEDKAK